ncbi:unnamed protein product [Brachionus calyciflorus]|uniref:Fibronectin type-III domain-containing protein n=1 Tax=Brachionus calyciflorus TaxID=104777 RepID=A0A813NQ95_9BILA|nr:unnamed protein product [Brachionus calyciflorus]
MKISTLSTILLLSHLFDKIKAQCLPNTFDIQLNLISVKELDIITFYRVTTNQSNPIEYTRKCLDILNFSAKSPNGLQITTITFNPDDLNKVLNYTFEKLYPLANYQISIGYKVKNFLDLEYKVNTTYHTCFSSPGKPEDLTAQSDGKSLNLKWRKPSTINAPDICYYLVTKRFLNETKPEEMRIYPEMFSFSGEDLKRDFEVRVSAYNDYECYRLKYPAAFKCAQLGQKTASSPVVIYKYKSNTIHPFNSSNCLNFLSKSLIFLYFLKFLI